MLEPRQGLVGRDQNGPEEDGSRGVPSRAEAHADEKGQAKEGGNRGMKSDEVLTGPRFG